MTNSQEEHMLIEVSDDCERLILDDGSQWSVQPGDMPTICTWLPTSDISI